MQTTSLLKNNIFMLPIKIEVDISHEDKQRNFEKLRQISMLGENWNGYGAEPFSPELIIKMCRVLNNLHIQPEIFPTALGSIQLEYEKNNGNYLEIQVTEEDKCSVFELIDNQVKNFNVSVTELNRLVDEFYE